MTAPFASGAGRTTSAMASDGGSGETQARVTPGEAEAEAEAEADRRNRHALADTELGDDATDRGR